MNALDRFQEAAKKTARPTPALDTLFIGLSAEVGELCSERMREIRSDRSALGLQEVKSELGDILWYVANIADYYDLTLDQVSEYNQIKLIKRGMHK
jgi:NTP pyrophosphatase (non-canonical NTP hydrolase)